MLGTLGTAALTNSGQMTGGAGGPATSGVGGGNTIGGPDVGFGGGFGDVRINTGGAPGLPVWVAVSIAAAVGFALYRMA